MGRGTTTGFAGKETGVWWWGIGQFALGTFFIMKRRPPRSTLFPCTTLSRSNDCTTLHDENATCGARCQLDGTCSAGDDCASRFVDNSTCGAVCVGGACSVGAACQFDEETSCGSACQGDGTCSAGNDCSPRYGANATCGSVCQTDGTCSVGLDCTTLFPGNDT